MKDPARPLPTLRISRVFSLTMIVMAAVLSATVSFTQQSTPPKKIKIDFDKATVLHDAKTRLPVGQSPDSSAAEGKMLLIVSNEGSSWAHLKISHLNDDDPVFEANIPPPKDDWHFRMPNSEMILTLPAGKYKVQAFAEEFSSGPATASTTIEGISTKGYFLSVVPEETVMSPQTPAAPGQGPSQETQSALRGVIVRGENNRAAVVTSVAKGSPADAAGIRPGDEISDIWVPGQQYPYAIWDEEDMAPLVPHCAPDCILAIKAVRPGLPSPPLFGTLLLLGGTGFSYFLSECGPSQDAIGENVAVNLNQLNAAGNDFKTIKVHKRGYDGCIDQSPTNSITLLIPGVTGRLNTRLPTECCTHPDLRFNAAMAETAGLTGSARSPGPTTTGIEREIERIRTGQHAAMPLAEAAPSALAGWTRMVVENDTEYTLTVFLSGPQEDRFEIAPRGSQTLNMLPGQYEVAARVSNPAVIPFYGQRSCGPNTRYSEHIYILSQTH